MVFIGGRAPLDQVVDRGELLVADLAGGERVDGARLAEQQVGDVVADGEAGSGEVEAVQDVVSVVMLWLKRQPDLRYVPGARRCGVVTAVGGPTYPGPHG